MDYARNPQFIVQPLNDIEVVITLNSENAREAQFGIYRLEENEPCL